MTDGTSTSIAIFLPAFFLQNKCNRAGDFF